MLECILNTNKSPATLSSASNSPLSVYSNPTRGSFKCNFELNSVVISFEVPSNLKNQYTFKAGQYLTLSSNINGENVKRSYSICSSPQSQNLQVGVKAIENGIFSNYVNDALREGDSIEVSAPEGRFVLENNNQGNYCAFVAGSGITPLMSIIPDVLDNNENSIFVLGYGNKPRPVQCFQTLLMS